MSRSSQRQLAVLVVDDSAVVRRYMSSLLSRAGDLSVQTASDPLIAMRKMERVRPDVILLDIEMPRMDGLTFLRKIMAEDPIPVVICSGHVGQGTRAAIEALRHGAVEIVIKPKLAVREFLQDSAVMLTDTVRAAAQARVARRGESVPGPGAAAPRLSQAGWPSLPASAVARRVIAIGASTGGPEAIRLVLEALPADAPGTAIVQHMPETFTGAFAKRLDESCRMRVVEARDGQPLAPGLALLAPGDHHLELVRGAEGYAARVFRGPLVSRHRPSANVLFKSVARAAGADAVGLLMTGMGDDGVEGLAEMRRAGATTAAQDRESCVVYGMPREAVRRQAAAHVVPLAEMPSFLMSSALG